MAESAFYVVGIPSLRAELLGLVTLIALCWLALSPMRLCQIQAAFHHAIASKKDTIRLCISMVTIQFEVIVISQQ